MDSILARIESLGFTLPEVPIPVAAYVNCVRSGNLLFLSGGLPIDGDKKVIGKVPGDVSIEEAQEGARIIILNRLAVVKQEIGSLDKVKQIVALNGFVNSAPDFYGHPQVVNGASDLMVEVFGEAGRHARSAVGVYRLQGMEVRAVTLLGRVEALQGFDAVAASHANAMRQGEEPTLHRLGRGQLPTLLGGEALQATPAAGERRLFETQPVGPDVIPGLGCQLLLAADGADMVRH